MTDSPLRERAKARRRAAIERAAMRLFAERGYDSTTVADIAEAAEVSPRTVSIHFPTKLDLALSKANTAADRFVAAMQAKGRDESALDVLSAVMRAEAEHTDDETAALEAAMFHANPTLRASHTAPINRALQAGADLLPAELGLPENDHRVILLHSAIAAISSEYSAMIAAGNSREDIHDTVMRFLRAGIAAIQDDTAIQDEQ